MAVYRMTGRGHISARWPAFTRLAAGMAVLGLAVGAVFPFFAALLGVPSRYAEDPVFRAACLAAGLVLGGANWLLTRYVIGGRLRVLAGRLTDVARTVGDPLSASSAPARPATELALPVGSADDLGTTAAAFNALLGALERERRFRSVVQATSDVLALLTPTGQVAFVSDSISTVLGWSREDVVGRHAQELLHADDADLFTEDGHPVIRDQDLSQVFLVQARHRDGGWRHLEVSSSDRRGDPVIDGLLLTARDVTERLELQRELAHQATHDELTGLPNRAALLARGAELLARSTPLAVLLMDLDRFKEVNDTLGHSYGDRLLAQVGARLQPLLRDLDLLARLGGDEFAVLLPGVTAQEARVAALRLRDALGAPFPVEGLSLDVGASIGVAVGGTPEEIGALLRQADVAMYVAKERQSGVELYDPSTDEHDRRRRLLTELRRT
jgi:diguanylate cyclase (GGDEF)-like protein/PAS domain S-box-containing protein